ncbi:hypothetical protein BKA69DRAFT_1129667 [Paraphysoderma sedebokerense]|nr:hypothetical protein BKA69DRAFT_1129667 [Paraphysoderma sedebokerense]
MRIYQRQREHESSLVPSPHLHGVLAGRVLSSFSSVVGRFIANSETTRSNDPHLVIETDDVVVSVDFRNFNETADKVPEQERRVLELFLEERCGDGERELKFALLLMNSQGDTPGLLKPLDILSDSGHSFRMPTKTYRIIYPYATDGSLYDYLQKGNRLSEEEFLALMIDSALGVQFMNRHFVVSGHLTPHHLFGFTDGDGKLRWRWGDWELLKYNDTLMNKRGYWNYSYAPLELHNSGSTITTAVDIFMLATTWLFVDTLLNIDDLAQEKADQKDTGSHSYSRHFLSRMLEQEVSIRAEIDEAVEFYRITERSLYFLFEELAGFVSGCDS